MSSMSKKMYKCGENREREHLDDGGGNIDELPDLMLQNTQTNIKAHKNKLKVKHTKQAKIKETEIWYKKGWKQTTHKSGPQE